MVIDSSNNDIRFIMVTEDYVSFATAKLLKEKGFPQEYDIFHSMVYNEEDYEDEYEVQRMEFVFKIRGNYVHKI